MYGKHEDVTGARMRNDGSVVDGRRRRVAFWIVAVMLILFVSAASAPSPLYAIYQARFGFSASVLTAIFAVYAIAVLVAVLPAGELSDEVGRRPMIVGGLLVQMLALALFMVAGDVVLLFVSRILQGLSVGVVIGALSALLVDLQDRDSARGPLLASVASPIGLAAGALLAGVLVEYVAGPLHTIYWVLLALFVLALIALFAFVPETRKRVPGQRIELGFEVRIPARARRSFFALTPGLVAAWALAGLFLSLGPSLTKSILGTGSDLVGALLPTVLCATAAVGAVATRAWVARLAVVVGGLLLAIGVAIAIVGMLSGSPLPLYLGSGLAGLGFGASQGGSFRMVTPLARPNERASLLAALYLVNYIAFSVPALIAGLAVTRYGLRDTATVYAAVVIVLALAAVAATERTLRGRVSQPRTEGQVVVPPVG